MPLITARQRSCGKVMFSVVSVHHSVREGGGCPMWPLLMMHLTSVYRTPPPLPSGHGAHCIGCPIPASPRHWTSLYRDPPSPGPPGHVQICSNWTSMYSHPTPTRLVARTGDLFKLVHPRIPPPGADIWGYLSMYGRQAGTWVPWI